jgi:hypothetical protein
MGLPLQLTSAVLKRSPPGAQASSPPWTWDMLLPKMDLLASAPLGQGKYPNAFW